MKVADICFEHIEHTEELDEFSEGDVVEYDDDGHVGVITGKLTETMNWPTDDDSTEEIEASSDNPVYIVARETGGSKPFRADELTSISQDDAFGDIDADPEEVKEDAELARVYYVANDPSDFEQIQTAKETIRQREAELIAVPGVDDPGVGFDSWPDSWEDADKPARLIALDAWTSMGGTWTGCMSEIKSKRICSAFKDEILGTERWRNRF